MTPMTMILAGCAILALLIAIVLTRRRRARAHRVEPLPPLVFEVHDRREPLLRPAGFATSGAGTFTPPAIWPTPNGRVVAPPAPAPHGYLPGWLEIATGPGKGEAIRFPRLESGAPDYTLGRGDGPPQTHIRLPVTSVSRQQARMHHENGRWQVVNLSRTNPTCVNGRTLNAPDGAHWLRDGDRVEMGDLVLRFRDR